VYFCIERELQVLFYQTVRCNGTVCNVVLKRNYRRYCTRLFGGIRDVSAMVTDR